MPHSQEEKILAKETLKQRIDAGEFVITCELTPPKGTDLVPLFEKAELLRNLVHAFNLTESHSARMAMEPTAVAHLLLDRGIEPIVQIGPHETRIESQFKQACWELLLSECQIWFSWEATRQNTVIIRMQNCFRPICFATP